MFVERSFRTSLVFVLNLLVEYLPVTSFFDICRHAKYQPGRIIIKAGTNLVVTALCQRLVLVKGASVFPLRSCNIENAFPGARRDHVDKSQ